MVVGSDRVLWLTGAYCLAYVCAECCFPLFGPSMEAMRATSSITMAELTAMPSAYSAGGVAGQVGACAEMRSTERTVFVLLHLS